MGVARNTGEWAWEGASGLSIGQDAMWVGIHTVEWPVRKAIFISRDHLEIIGTEDFGSPKRGAIFKTEYAINEGEMEVFRWE